MKRLLVFWTIFFVVVLPAHAQQAPPRIEPPQQQPQQVQDTVRHGISPRSAFIRSLIIPGWGQFSVGAKTRAGIFFVLQSASYYMLGKTLHKLGAAQDVQKERVTFVTDSLRAEMAQDTALNRELATDTAFQRKLDADSLVVDIRSLVNSRKEQRQDWIAYTLFTTLASGVDAYVAAHLADFPGEITTRPTSDGRAQLKITLPLQRRP